MLNLTCEWGNGIERVVMFLNNIAFHIISYITSYAHKSCMNTTQIMHNIDRTYYLSIINILIAKRSKYAFLSIRID